jgi:uncharacterized protein (DUF2141 family)
MRTPLRPTRLAYYALGLVLVCPCVILCAQSRPNNPETARVEGEFKIAGVVVNSVSGAPLARARVTIVNTRNARDSQWRIAEEDGRFEFTGLKSGKYSLQGARSGFISSAYEQHAQFSTAIVTGAPLDTENLTLRLVPVAMISGKILDESGDPIRNAGVKLFRENHNMGVTQIVPVAFASSDDRGYYDFWPVIPGTYYVSATARPWYAAHPPSVHAEGGGTSFRAVDAALDVCYLSTYYGDTTETESAIPIPIKGGEHAEIDIHMEPVPSLHLLFHVPEGEQNGFIAPEFQKRVFDSVEEVETGGSQQLSPDTFELVGVPTGKYTVRFRGSTPDEPGRSAEMKITNDGQELDLSSGEPLGSLKLSVKILGGENLPQSLFVALRDAQLRTVESRAVDRNGEVNFEGLPAGRYAIAASSTSKPYSVVRTSSQGTETSGNGFDLTPGSSISMSASLLSGKARVEGFVMRSGKSAAGVMVVLVPADPESNIDLFRRDESDFDGSFVLPGVVPGNYSVIAIEDGWAVDWSRPAVLARYTPRGQKLTVGPQSQGTVSLSEPVEVQPR